MNARHPAIEAVVEMNASLDKIARTLPNEVFCTSCKRRQKVNPAICIRHGWPSCCGRTMQLAEIPKLPLAAMKTQRP